MYCTEFLVKGTGLSTNQIQKDLANRGDSLLVVGTPDLVKIHVHTNNPGWVLEYAVTLGTLSEIQINNMVEQNARASAQNSEIAVQNEEAVKKSLAVVAVAAGQGLADIFTSLGVDCIVEGGQTMNPSIEQLKEAVEVSGGSKVIILPNNSNVVLTSQQVCHLTDIDVSVVPTKTIPQGIGAMLAYSSDTSFERNTQEMTRAAECVKTGEVTFAVRSTRYNGFDIEEGDFIGLADGELVVNGKDRDGIALDLLDKMGAVEAEIITIFYGADIAEDTANTFAEAVRTRYDNAEVEVQLGGQPLYYYLMSVE
jgi:DAK2 domain fusion protein YloV